MPVVACPSPLPVSPCFPDPESRNLNRLRLISFRLACAYARLRHVFALILLHLAAALFHALVRRDGVFDAMAPVSSHHEIAPAE